MTIIMGIDPGISGATTRKKRGRYGIRKIEGQKWSTKYHGVIDCGGGVFREPYVWNGKSANRYFIETFCSQCAKIILQDRANSKRSKNAFCSVQCKTAFINAKSAGNKIVKKREHGAGHHVLVKDHAHPRRGGNNSVYEHILVAEKKIGRFLNAGERIHHINCIKNDNRPENLFVCANNAEHLKIHGSLNRCVAQLIEMGVLRFDEVTKTYVAVSK